MLDYNILKNTVVDKLSGMNYPLDKERRTTDEVKNDYINYVENILDNWDHYFAVPCESVRIEEDSFDQGRCRGVVFLDKSGNTILDYRHAKAAATFEALRINDGTLFVPDVTWIDSTFKESSRFAEVRNIVMEYPQTGIGELGKSPVLNTITYDDFTVPYDNGGYLAGFVRHELEQDHMFEYDNIKEDFTERMTRKIPAPSGVTPGYLLDTYKSISRTFIEQLSEARKDYLNGAWTTEAWSRYGSIDAYSVGQRERKLKDILLKQGMPEPDSSRLNFIAQIAEMADFSTEKIAELYPRVEEYYQKGIPLSYSITALMYDEKNADKILGSPYIKELFTMCNCSGWKGENLSSKRAVADWVINHPDADRETISRVFKARDYIYIPLPEENELLAELTRREKEIGECQKDIGATVLSVSEKDALFFLGQSIDDERRHDFYEYALRRREEELQMPFSAPFPDNKTDYDKYRDMFETSEELRKELDALGISYTDKSFIDECAEDCLKSQLPVKEFARKYDEELLKTIGDGFSVACYMQAAMAISEKNREKVCASFKNSSEIPVTRSKLRVLGNVMNDLYHLPPNHDENVVRSNKAAIRYINEHWDALTKDDVEFIGSYSVVLSKMFDKDAPVSAYRDYVLDGAEEIKAKSDGLYESPCGIINAMSKAVPKERRCAYQNYLIKKAHENASNIQYRQDKLREAFERTGGIEALIDVLNTAVWSDDFQNRKVKPLAEMFKEEHKGNIPKIINDLALASDAYHIPAEDMVDKFDVGIVKHIRRNSVPDMCVPLLYTKLSRNEIDESLKSPYLFQICDCCGRSFKNEEYKNVAEWIIKHPDTNNKTIEDMIRLGTSLKGITPVTAVDEIRAKLSAGRGLQEIQAIERKYEDFHFSECNCELEQTDITYGNYRMRFLDANDPRQAMLGYDTCCCQRLGEAGETAMMFGLVHDKAGFWIMEDTRTGKILAQAETWLDDQNESTLVFDNIEFADDKDVSNYEDAIGAWCERSAYKNIIMGNGYNELEGTTELKDFSDTDMNPPCPEIDWMEYNVYASGNWEVTPIMSDEDKEKYMNDPYAAFQNADIYTDVYEGYSTYSINASVIKEDGKTLIGDINKIHEEFDRRETVKKKENITAISIDSAEQTVHEWGAPDTKQSEYEWGSNGWNNDESYAVGDD